MWQQTLFVVKDTLTASQYEDLERKLTEVPTELELTRELPKKFETEVIFSNNRRKLVKFDKKTKKQKTKKKTVDQQIILISEDRTKN